jgi:ATP-dependent DNA ligase
MAHLPLLNACLPTRGTKVPAGPEWLHEIKHDGYRLIVVRDGASVRVFTRNGHDWTGHYPLIVEAAQGPSEARPSAAEPRTMRSLWRDCPGITASHLVY